MRTSSLSLPSVTPPFWAEDESLPHENYSPETLDGSSVRLLLITDDPQAVVARAIALGATSVYPVAKQHRWVLGRIRDPFEHHWQIGRPLVHWPAGAVRG